MPYVCFNNSLHILFNFGFYNILYCGGLYSGYSSPVLYIWIKYIPIVNSGNTNLGVDYSYKVLYCI
jgi:hypothetical protein